MEKDYCVHPGLFIKAILMSINKTQKWLAEEMGVNKVIVNDIIRGRRNITPALADAFQKATGMNAEILLSQQNKYDLFILRKNKPLYEIVAEQNDSLCWQEVKADSFDLAEMHIFAVAV